jgi:putative transposase
VWQCLPNQMEQLGLAFPKRGGKRRHAGRKPNGERPLVSHSARPVFSATAAVLVTLRVAPHVWNLRSRRCFRAVEECLIDGRDRFSLCVVELSILGNHLHLLVEADSNGALSKGMKGLCVRLAKSLNRVMRRHGAVFADHYHSRVLDSPTQVANAMAYIVANAEHHYGERGPDRYSSHVYDPAQRARVLSTPRSWLLRTGWRKAHRLPECLTAPAHRRVPTVAERITHYGVRASNPERCARRFDSGDILSVWLPRRIRSAAPPLRSVGLR